MILPHGCIKTNGSDLVVIAKMFVACPMPELMGFASLYPSYEISPTLRKADTSLAFQGGHLICLPHPESGGID
jgi:hypothetical protein